MGLFFWRRQSRGRWHLARFARRKRSRARGDDQDRTAGTRRLHDLDGGLRLLLQEREEISGGAEEASRRTRGAARESDSQETRRSKEPAAGQRAFRLGTV